MVGSWVTAEDHSRKLHSRRPSGCPRGHIDHVTSLGGKEKNVKQNLVKWAQFVLGGVACVRTHTHTQMHKHEIISHDWRTV